MDYGWTSMSALGTAGSIAMTPTMARLVGASKECFAQGHIITTFHQPGTNVVCVDCALSAVAQEGAEPQSVLSSHKHGNCELCDQIEADLTAAQDAIRLAHELIVGRRRLRGWGVADWEQYPAVKAALQETP